MHRLGHDILRLRVLGVVLALWMGARGEAVRDGGEGYRIIEVVTDTLVSLNVARTAHVSLCIDGELTVLGGHTDGFVPTATAEYLHDGHWHTVPLVYPHDAGVGIRLRSGKVFLAGGFREDLGIGQLYAAEMYDPATHTSQGFGCMDRKRAFPSAIEMDDGQVVISGNWYAEDEIEMFGDVYDPFKTNAVGIKPVSYARAKPYILKVSEDDAIVFGSLNNYNEPVDDVIIDRLKGVSYREPFLEAWKPTRTIGVRRSYNQFIGDEAEGRYEWLLPVEDQAGRVAIARVTGAPPGEAHSPGNGMSDSQDGAKPTFALLPTQQPIPDSINGKPILYSSLICDRGRGMAYLIGENDEARIFVVAIPYDTAETAPLTIYMTQPQPIAAQSSSPMLTAEGDLVFAGGHLINNFAPSNAVIRVPLGQRGTENLTTASEAGGHWLWILWVVAFLAVCDVAVNVIKAGRRRPSPQSVDESPNPQSVDAGAIPPEDGMAELFKRIEVVMDQEQLYLNPNLRASDVAARVGSNITYVSAAINSQCGCSFTQLLTDYRIRHAQQLMREDPDEKISTIATHSGFSTDSTFFRAFRAVTGMTPKEWIATIRDSQQ